MGVVSEGGVSASASSVYVCVVCLRLCLRLCLYLCVGVCGYTLYAGLCQASRHMCWIRSWALSSLGVGVNSSRTWLRTYIQSGACWNSELMA